MNYEFDPTDENVLVIEVYGKIHDLTGSEESHVLIKDVPGDEFDEKYPSKYWNITHVIKDMFCIVRKRNIVRKSVMINE